MLGRAAVAIWCDIAPQVEAEFSDWHTHEHIPERVAIPGFVRGTRCKAVAGEGYFMLYEVKQLAVLTEGPYLERLNDPTPWSRKMMPHHRNMVRSLCRVRASFGGGTAPFLATVRFSPSPRKSTSVARWLSSELLPRLPASRGLAGAQLLQSQPTPSAETTEQKIRGGDRQADWIILASGYELDAQRKLLETDLAASALEAHGALPGTVSGLYTLCYSLTEREVR
jgi:hypothetical protein